MAEGYNSENPTSWRECYAERADDIHDRLPDDADQGIILNRSSSLADLRGQIRKSALQGQKE